MDVTLVTVRTPRGEMRVPRLLMKMWNMVTLVRMWELW
jgi:hypothetical protein